MDQKLKQRLVGAVVITALAAIFLPMLFDDPVEKSGKTVSELKIPDFPDDEFESHVQSLPMDADPMTAVEKGSSPDEAGEKDAPASIPSGSEIEENKAVDPQFVRWVIQVGSFGEEKNAQAFRDTLRKQGFPAFVEKYGSMYRVRVGPELDKSRAEKTKALLESKNQIKSILVPE
ncbi:MAG: SPOR domain-containing protein [Gammaproteobacteria bacterium]